MNDLPWMVLGVSLLILSVAGWLIYKVGYEVGWHEGRDEANARAHDREMEKHRKQWEHAQSYFKGIQKMDGQ